MLPKNPVDMFALLYGQLLHRAYGDIAEAARRKRLTEHDIDLIEKEVLALLRDSPDFAHEFETFEVEPVKARVLANLKEWFEIAKRTRIRKISEKP